MTELVRIEENKASVIPNETSLISWIAQNLSSRLQKYVPGGPGVTSTLCLFALSKVPVLGWTMELANELIINAHLEDHQFEIKRLTERVNRLEKTEFAKSYGPFLEVLNTYDEHAGSELDGSYAEDPVVENFCETIIAQRLRGEYDERMIQALAASVFHAAGLPMDRRTYLIKRFGQILMTIQANDISVLRVINDPVGHIPSIDSTSQLSELNKKCRGAIPQEMLFRWEREQGASGVVQLTFDLLMAQGLLERGDRINPTIDELSGDQATYRVTQLCKQLLDFLAVEGHDWEPTITSAESKTSFYAGA